MKLNLSRIILFAALAILCCTAGCASLNHAIAKDNYITREVQNYTFNTDLGSAMAQAHALLFSSGYPVIHGTPYSLETDWGQIETHTVRRYLVTGANVSGGCSIHFDYIEETHTPNFKPATSSGRDYVMEYELIKRLEPANWSSIESKAEAYAKAHEK